jgi:hypothetical protein
MSWTEPARVQAAASASFLQQGMVVHEIANLDSAVASDLVSPDDLPWLAVPDGVLEFDKPAPTG